MAGEIYSSFTSGSTATAALTTRNVLLQSTAFVSGSTASAALTTRQILLRSTAFVSGSVVAATLTTRNVLLRSLDRLSGSTASAALTTRNVLLRSLGFVSGSSSLAAATVALLTTPKPSLVSTGKSRRARLTLPGSSLSLKEVMQQIYSLWGRSSCTDCSDAEVQRDALVCVNHALQTLYSKARLLEWFNREELTTTITGGTSSVALAQTIQTVLGPVRLSDAGDLIPLTRLDTRAELDAYVDLGYGGAAYAPERPRAYWLDSTRQALDDSVTLTIHVAPTPAADADLRLSVVYEAERYTWPDVKNAARLRIPHRYVETLLLPLALKTATSYRHLLRRELQPQIDEAYARAAEALGLVSTDPPAANKA